MIREAGPDDHQTIHALNSLCPGIFPKLTIDHLTKGHWWLAVEDGTTIGFAGMVPFGLEGIGYLKRCYVRPVHRGKGLQREFMRLREAKAAQLGWRVLVGESRYGNIHSARNFRESGFKQFQPDQPWAEESEYWIKNISDIREAVVAQFVDDGQGVILMLGEGNHHCDRWSLSPSLLRKLAREAFPLVI